MSTKNLLIMLLFLLTGGGIGYAFFSSYPDLLLPNSPIEHTLVATQINEVFQTRILFSLFVALAFLAIPLSAWISRKYSRSALALKTTLVFMVVTAVSAFATIYYYQNYFAEMFASLESQQGISIKLDTIPFYQVPLISAAIPIALSILVQVFGTKKITSKNGSNPLGSFLLP